MKAHRRVKYRIFLRCGRDDLKARTSAIMFSGARHIAKFGATAILASSPMLSARLGRIERAGALTILNFHRVDDRHFSSYDRDRAAPL
jgi:hypothetical protein